MTLTRFPHSDIPGSTLGCQLPRAYRRLQRPSSALDAKASTMRPSQLAKQQSKQTHKNKKATKMLASTIHNSNNKPTPTTTHTRVPPAGQAPKTTTPPPQQTRGGLMSQTPNSVPTPHQAGVSMIPPSSHPQHTGTRPPPPPTGRRPPGPNHGCSLERR